MPNVQALDKAGFVRMSAGARYRAKLARYPERRLECGLARAARLLRRALRQLLALRRKRA